MSLHREGIQDYLAILGDADKFKELTGIEVREEAKAEDKKEDETNDLFGDTDNYPNEEMSKVIEVAQEQDEIMLEKVIENSIEEAQQQLEAKLDQEHLDSQVEIENTEELKKDAIEEIQVNNEEKVEEIKANEEIKKAESKDTEEVKLEKTPDTSDPQVEGYLDELTLALKESIEELKETENAHDTLKEEIDMEKSKLESEKLLSDP